MQIEHVQLRKRRQILDLLDVVFAEHQHTQGGDRVQVVDLLNVIVVQVQEDQVGQRHQVLDSCDQVMLQIEQSKSLFAFKQWHMTQFSLVQLESLRIGGSLTRLTIDDKDAWDLGQLCEDDLVLIFNSSDDTVR